MDEWWPSVSEQSVKQEVDDMGSPEFWRDHCQKATCGNRFIADSRPTDASDLFATTCDLKGKVSDSCDMRPLNKLALECVVSKDAGNLPEDRARAFLPQDHHGGYSFR